MIYTKCFDLFSFKTKKNIYKSLKMSAAVVIGAVRIKYGILTAAVASRK